MRLSIMLFVYLYTDRLFIQRKHYVTEKLFKLTINCNMKEKERRIQKGSLPRTLNVLYITCGPHAEMYREFHCYLFGTIACHMRVNPQDGDV